MDVAKAAASRRDDAHPAPPPDDTPTKRAKLADDTKPEAPLSETIVRQSLLSAESRAELRDQFANAQVSLTLPVLRIPAFLLHRARAPSPRIFRKGRALNVWGELQNRGMLPLPLHAYERVPHLC